MLLPLNFDVGVFTQISWNAATFGLIVVGPFIAIAHSFYVFALMKGGAIQASFATIIATIMGVFWGVVILAESNTINVWISLAMILGALNILRNANEGRASSNENREVVTET